MSHILFYGSSDAQGVPRMLCNCGVCNSKNSLNVRKRPSILVSVPNKELLIDLSPDFRKQFLMYNNKKIPEFVIITHAHNDHIAGLGDYADLCFWNETPVTIAGSPEVIETLESRYPYLLNKREITFKAQKEFIIEDMEITLSKVNHGLNGYSYGILFEDSIRRWAYISDAFNVSSEQWMPFYNLDLLILGTSYWKEGNHSEKRSLYDVSEALKIRNELNVKRLILTHLSHDINFVKHDKLLPPHVSLAFDGMRLELPE